MASSAEAVKVLGIVGAGQMGGGIAQVASQVAGLDVLLFDARDGAAEDAKGFMDKLMSRHVEKGKLSEDDKTAALARITPVASLSDVAQADFVVEAATENFDVKKAIFAELTAAARPGTILATNTSSISITKIGAVSQEPDNVIGMHFMNPVPVMKMVEIIPSLATSEATLATTLGLAQRMGKVTAQSRDMPGFIANRVLMPYINEAVQALQDGVGTKEDIDSCLKLGTGVPMGPLTLADFIGLDTCLAIMRVLHTEFGDSKYRPCPLLVQYVDAGWLGKKTKKGFYDY